MSKEVLGIITSHGFQDHIPNADNADNADNAEIAQYASEDKSKGTIEDRLTSLGFKEGVITFMGVECDSTSYDTNYGVVKRIGKYVFGEVRLQRAISSESYNKYFAVTEDTPLFTVPEDFRSTGAGKRGGCATIGAEGSGYSIVFYFEMNSTRGYVRNRIVEPFVKGENSIYQFCFQFWYLSEIGG